MSTASPRIAFSLGLALFSCACAGRTAAWEEGESTPPAATDAGADAKEEVKAESSDEEKGDEAWLQRTSPENLRRAISFWEKTAGCGAGTSSPADRCAAIEKSADKVELLTKLTRAHYFLADGYLRADEAQYLETMNRGVWWGERALVAASPAFEAKMREKGKFAEAIGLVGKDGVGAMYWYAASLGKWAKRTSFAVLIGQKDNIRATMEQVLELGVDYFHGAPDRYFGAFYSIAPKFAGGDLEKSKTHFEASLKRAPHYLGTKVLMAEHLATKLDDKEMFERLLNEVIDTPNDEIPQDLWPEAEVERIKARELLENSDF